MLKAEGKKFTMNGEDFFLYSGEMHYFRVKKKDWRTHLQNMKKAHLNTVSTYIPWSWHEIKEGTFDLTGETVPERDIIGFLDMAQEEGLYVTVKPGPYILAEYLNQGIPEWLIKEYPEIQVQDPWGNYNMPFVCTFMSKTYLDFSLKWFDQIMPILRDRQISNGGTVAMMQVCNEVGVQQWLGGIGDYNKETIAYYHEYLENTYKTIGALNRKYKTSYKSFSTVRPPHGTVNDKHDFGRYHDWHLFHRWYYWYYVNFLMKEIRDRGVDVQFYHNVPGWVYGKADEFPVNISAYDELAKMSPDMILGVDHIPENVTFRNFHDDLVVNEMVKAVQGGKAPVWSAEFQAGSREHCVKAYPREMDLFYKASLAHGIVGWNYYMFSQGKNDYRKGIYGPTFYWYTPLDISGNPTEAYPDIKRLGKWLKTHGKDLVNTDKKSDLGIAFYKPYYQTEFFYPLFEKMKNLDVGRLGLRYDTKNFRDMYYFEGILKVAQMLNLDFETPDLEVASVDDLLRHKQLWLCSLEYMDEATQKKLVSYVKKGGHLIVYPTMPKFDLYLKKCTFLMDALNIKPKSFSYPIDNKIEFKDNQEVASFGLVHIFDKKTGSLSGKTSKGTYCTVDKKFGKGNVTVIGTGFAYQIEEHVSMYKDFFSTDAIKPVVKSSNEDIVTLKRTGKNGDFLFILNYHPEDLDVSVKPGKGITIPSEGTLRIPRTYGLMLNLNKKLSDAVTLVYATSEIIDIKEKKNCLELTLLAHRKIAGEMFLKSSVKIKEIMLGKKKLKSKSCKDGLLIQYPHSDCEEVLTLVF